MSRDRYFRRARIHRVRALRVTSTWGIFGRYTTGVPIRSTVRLGKLKPSTCAYGCCRHEQWLTNRPAAGVAVERNRAKKPILHKGRKP